MMWRRRQGAQTSLCDHVPASFRDQNVIGISNCGRAYSTDIYAIIVPLLLRNLDVMTSACRSITFDYADDSHSDVSSHAKVEAARAICEVHEFEES